MNRVIDKLKNKLYYMKIMVSLVTLCTIIVLTMSVIFSNMYESSLVNSVTREYEDSVDRMSLGLENILKQADNLYTSMQLNRDVFNFLYTREEDAILAMKAQNAVTQAKHSNPYIYSICLYNSYLDNYISTGSPMPDQTKMDQILKKRMMHPGILSKRHVEKLSFDTGKECILSIQYKEFSMNNKLQASMLINIDEKQVRKDIISDHTGLTVVINEDGNPVIFNVSGSPEEKLLMDFVKKNIISAGMNKGTVKYSGDKEAYLITYLRSNLANWYVINARPYSNITQAIKSKEALLNILCIAILVVFIGISFIISSRLYSPIRKVMEALKARIPFINDQKSGEIPLIVDIVEDTLKRMNELADKNNESILMLKESYLRSLIMAGTDEENGSKLFNEDSLSIKFDNLIFVLLKIDDYKILEKRSSLLIETMICTTINEVLEKDFVYEKVRMYQGEICILMNFKESDENYFSMLIAALDKVKALVHKLIGTSVTIGIGGVANSTSECITAYKKAKDMTKYRFILGTNRIIYERYIEENLTRGLLYPVELKEKLLAAIRLNKKEEFQDTLEQIITLLGKFVYPDVVCILLKLVLDCIEAMNEITERIKIIEFDFDEFNTIFLEFLTLEHAKSWLIKLFDEYRTVVEKIDNLKEDKYYKMVEETKEFIHENYRDTSLSVEMLAEKMGYSHKYFSKVFKEISGQYLSDYIRQIRIAKAKELLCQEELKINEILGMTGFVNPSYFYAAFKNAVGMTPAEYRKFYQKTE